MNARPLHESKTSTSACRRTGADERPGRGAPQASPRGGRRRTGLPRPCQGAATLQEPPRSSGGVRYLGPASLSVCERVDPDITNLSQSLIQRLTYQYLLGNKPNSAASSADSGGNSSMPGM